MKRNQSTILHRAALTLLTVAMTFVAQTAWADGNPTTYEGLVTAISNVTAGGTVTLGGDIELTSTININKAVTIDLNGHSVTYSASVPKIYVVSGGNLTFRDTGGGKVTNTGMGAAIMVNSGGILIVKGGTFDCSNGVAIENNGTTYIFGGTIWGKIKSVRNNGSLYVSNYNNIKKGIDNNDGNISTFTSDFAAVQITDQNVAILDGNYNGTDQINIDEEKAVDGVKMLRTFPTTMGSSQYSTLMLPFDVNTVKLVGVSGIYTFNGVTDDGNGNLTVNVEPVWEDTYSKHATLKAYKPYLVKMNAATLVINGGVTLKVTDPSTTSVEKDNWSLNGTLGYIQWLSTNDRKDEIGSVYGFAAGTNGSTISVGDFVKVKSGAFIYPLRAYLKYSPATSARGLKRGSETLPDRIPVVVRYDAPTGIAEMEREMSDGDAWFTIDGRRLSGEPTQHGIYIRQGRKHVIK